MSVTPDPDGLTVGGKKRYIVCAANRYGKYVVPGIRHGCPIMQQGIDNLPEGVEIEALLKVANDLDGLESMFGFIDQFGLYLTRKEAMRVAKANGQYVNFDENGHLELLYSEGYITMKKNKIRTRPNQKKARKSGKAINKAVSRRKRDIRPTLIFEAFGTWDNL